MATVTFTEQELVQVHMGLEARIEELDRLIDANPGTADAEDWGLQRMEARAALSIVERA